MSDRSICGLHVAVGWVSQGLGDQVLRAIRHGLRAPARSLTRHNHCVLPLCVVLPANVLTSCRLVKPFREGRAMLQIVLISPPILLPFQNPSLHALST